MKTNTPLPTIGIGIIEDNEDFAESLILLLKEMWQVEVLFHSTSIEDAVDHHARNIARCQCVLLDVNLAGMNGVEGISIIRMLCAPGTSLIMLTLLEDRNTIQAALKAGADGYLLKTDPILNLVGQVIHSVQNKFPAISQKVYQQLTTLANAAPARMVPDAELTKREKEIYQGVVKGYDYKTIAAELHVSTATVNFHLQNIFLKLGVRSKAELMSRHLQFS
ncbi:two component transcriptional regulator, LuxR family [Cnuella takakiae]|uniref:Two component transcriptional regulator, LuxR family n=1 Tax=Cnuella takakiae TaxID=1302690 RepID=A0A1M5GBY4_9BACT|nr:response regulator transcription factor [Cnuella takakiae]OLY92363.1 hypothetical protein BUE76_11020 [Cnuella takakiae]SHG01206.1 two component transcriptional regulator, LuxR family [Cnuella takakiae]